MTPVHPAEPPDDPAKLHQSDNLLWSVKAAPEKSAIQFATQHPGLGWMAMWLSRAQVEDLQTSFEFELVKIPEGVRQLAASWPRSERTLGGKLGYDRPMNRRHFIGLLGGAAALAARRARATGGQAADHRVLRQLPPRRAEAHGLPLSCSVCAKLGWIDGRTVTIEYRWAEGRNGSLRRSRRRIRPTQG